MLEWIVNVHDTVPCNRPSARDRQRITHEASAPYRQEAFSQNIIHHEQRRVACRLGSIKCRNGSKRLWVPCLLGLDQLSEWILWTYRAS